MHPALDPLAALDRYCSALVTRSFGLGRAPQLRFSTASALLTLEPSGFEAKFLDIHQPGRSRPVRGF